MPDTPTSGNIKVFCEEGLTLQLRNQAYTFQKIYYNASLRLNYTNEKKAIESLYNDSCKLIFISRRLGDKEMEQFKAKNLYPTQVCVGKSAVALVVSAENADSVISTERIKELLSGSDTAYAMVFDNDNSGSSRFLKDSLLGGKAFGRNCFAMKNSLQLAEYISVHKQSIGLLDYGWLSDLDDSTTKVLRSRVKILAVSKEGNKLAYMPDQSNIKTNDYPLCRWIYAIRRSGDFSLATGFITFVAGPKGAMMMLKQGLIPAIQPGRVVEINMNPYGEQ